MQWIQLLQKTLESLCLSELDALDTYVVRGSSAKSVADILLDSCLGLEVIRGPTSYDGEAYYLGSGSDVSISIRTNFVKSERESRYEYFRDDDVFIETEVKRHTEYVGSIIGELKGVLLSRVTRHDGHRLPR